MMNQISTIVVLALAASPACAKTIIVSVGEKGLVYDPSTIFAEKGDKVQFDFYPQNHSVVQAAFANPCNPINDTAFYSGYIPSSSGAASTTYVLTVNDTITPLWFYCSQGPHCQAGMVGVINPSNTSTTNTLDTFAANAKKVVKNVAPSTGVLGGVLQQGSSSNSTSGGTSSTSSGTATGTATSSGSGSSSTGTTTSSAAAKSSTSSAAVAKTALNGIVGGLGLVLGMGLL